MRRISTPIEIQGLKKTLHTLFDSKIPPLQIGTLENIEKNFLSKALAAFTIYKQTHCSIDAAADAIVDGGSDCGIDLIYFDPHFTILYLIQSKYCEKADAEPSLGEVSKFGNGVDYLLSSNWAQFSENQKIQARIPDISATLRNESLKVIAILVYSSFNNLHPDRLAIFQTLMDRYNTDEYLCFKHFNLVSIHDWIIGLDDGYLRDPINLIFQYPGSTNGNFKMIYGLVNINDLASIYRTCGADLVEANIRKYKGSTEVNKAIEFTLLHEPHLFHLFNNGITAYCSKWQPLPASRGNIEAQEIVIHDLNIVNGAQTLGIIGNQRDLPTEGLIFLKLISLSYSEDEREFANKLTKFTNNQNHISAEDFVALDSEHARIHKTLNFHNIKYQYKDEKPIKTPRKNYFSYKEACRALACKHNNDFSLIRCIISNPRRVSSVSIGTELFHKENSPRNIWRLVQIKRIVEKTMRQNSSTETGIRKDFFAYCRWLVLHIFYIILDIVDSEDLNLSDTEKNDVVQKCQEIAENMWNVLENKRFVTRDSLNNYSASRTMRSIFSDINDCKTINNTVLEIHEAGNK